MEPVDRLDYDWDRFFKKLERLAVEFFDDLFHRPNPAKSIGGTVGTPQPNKDNT